MAWRSNACDENEALMAENIQRLSSDKKCMAAKKAASRRK